MKLTEEYTYLGVNGTITSSVLLEGIYHTTKYRLTAEEGSLLTKDNTYKQTVLLLKKEDAALWQEVKNSGQMQPI